jgi:hypothetical protein
MLRQIEHRFQDHRNSENKKEHRQKLEEGGFVGWQN